MPEPRFPGTLFLGSSVHKGNPPSTLESAYSLDFRRGTKVMFTFTKIASGALRLYKATDGMGIKGTIDRTILPVLLDYLG
jgi:hypothetical protein